MAEKRYWSVVECDWLPSPEAPDMLATPWGVAAEKQSAGRPPAAAPGPELPGQRRPSPHQVDATR